jgi:hypothetical protein
MQLYFKIALIFGLTIFFFNEITSVNVVKNDMYFVRGGVRYKQTGTIYTLIFDLTIFLILNLIKACFFGIFWPTSTLIIGYSFYCSETPNYYYSPLSYY